MTPRHTAHEWRELTAKLIDLRDNPHAERSKRSKAEALLTEIRTNPDAVAAMKEGLMLPPIDVSDASVLGWDEVV